MSLRITPPPTPRSSEAVHNIVGEYIAEKKRETAEIAALETRRKRRPVLLGTLLILALAAWIGPSFLPKPSTALPAEQVEASTRMTLFLASERIRSFQKRTGHLPRRLADAGVDSTGISYEASDAGVFELAADGAGTPVVYRSTMHLQDFLGATFTILTTP